MHLPAAHIYNLYNKTCLRSANFREIASLPKSASNRGGVYVFIKAQLRGKHTYAPVLRWHGPGLLD
jgi:hypothetical protein